MKKLDNIATMEIAIEFHLPFATFLQFDMENMEFINKLIQ